MRLIRKNILLLDEVDSNKSILVNIPVGIIIKNQDTLIEYNEDYIIVEHTEKYDDDFWKQIKLYKSGNIANFIFNNEELTISLVYNNNDYLNAIGLIKDYHYIKHIPNGLFITLKRKQDILGVIVISKLTYTTPTGRQIYFSGNLINKDLKKELNDYANHCICWISRIVIEEKSKGYGEAFLNQLPEFLLSIFPNKKLEFIEVLTSIKEEDVANKLNQQNINISDFKLFQYKKDFFRKVGYLNVNLPDKNILGIRKNRIFEKDNIVFKKVKIKKFYYMNEINSQNRLFIPLNGEAYKWFKSGNKQWEVRKLNVGQYNLKNLIVGRKVELRLGYRPGNSIWGIIKEVRTYDNANNLVNEIDFKHLIPSANDSNEATQKIIDYVGSESKIIAIKIQYDE